MMRKFRLFGVLLLVLALFPFRAYAVDFWPNGSYWNGITSPGYYAALVRADDIYGAAAYGLNKDPASLSSDVKLKLSDSNYGGKFYEYAQTFYNVEGWQNMPEWVPTYVLAFTFGLGQTFERVYASEVTTTLRDEALRDFERVLAGEDLSGGGNDPADISGGLPDSIVLDSLHGNAPNNKYGDAFCAPSGSYTVNFSDKATVLSKIQAVGGRYLYAVYMPYFMGGSIQRYSSTVYFFTSESPVTFSYTSQSSSYRPLDVTAVSSSTIYRASVNGGTPVLYTRYPPTIAGSCSVSSLSFSSVGLSNTLPNSIRDGNTHGYLRCSQAASTSSAPVVVPPAGDWPEPEPTPTPTAPEIPTPTAPTDTPDPSPTEPTVVWPTAPIVVNPPEVTVEVTPSGLDYTELLTRINDNLNELNSYVQAINGSLNSLRSDIIGGFDDVVTSLRNIYQYLQHLNDILELHCKHLRDALDDAIYNLELYIKSLFEWLPQQLDFDANFDYDDSGIKSYLQRILNKIPGGATGTPQTYMPNPQADEPGFFDWLLDLWHRFLIDLVSVLPDELGGLVDAFSQLTHYFPFSIPWDLAAMLALFEHEPVTPVFDVPWGFGGDEGEIEMVRVDLSAWDGVMEMVRPVFLVGFCFQLALITKDLLSNFDINKGGV